MAVIYNEIDPYAAKWLENLIDAGHIAWGYVDRRSIKEIEPDDLRGFSQVHFFAGIGVWSHALRRAGWPDDRPIWTGSCPCQPFSDAGSKKGFNDERHLWPEMFRLVAQCRPATIVGEQVASKDGLGWIDLVSADLENAQYAFAAADLCAAGFGGAHIRQRLYWLAHRLHAERGSVGINRKDGCDRTDYGRQEAYGDTGTRGEIYGLADSNNARLERRPELRECADQRLAGSGSLVSGVDNADYKRFGKTRPSLARQPVAGRDDTERMGDGRRTSAPMLGRHLVDWLFCRDGKWRPVGARIQPLANAVACGMGRLRASIVDALEKEMSKYAKAFSRDPREDLRDLWEGLPSTCLPEREARADNSFHEKEILFAFLCQLSAQGWAFAQGIPCPSEEGEAINVRVLWDRQAASRASRGRGLDQQRPDQPSDALHFLSSILARHASQAWQEAVVANARISFPLTEISDRRTGRLRAYGNALDAETATQFVETVMEIV